MSVDFAIQKDEEEKKRIEHARQQDEKEKKRIERNEQSLGKSASNAQRQIRPSRRQSPQSELTYEQRANLRHTQERTRLYTLSTAQHARVLLLSAKDKMSEITDITRDLRDQVEKNSLKTKRIKEKTALSVDGAKRLHKKMKRARTQSRRPKLGSSFNKRLAGKVASILANNNPLF